MSSRWASGSSPVVKLHPLSVLNIRSRTRLLSIKLTQIIAWSIFICACGSKTEAKPADPYRQDVLAAYKIVASDFQRQVLKDGLITRQEYEEAVNRFLDCMKKSGYPMGKVDNFGIYNYQIEGNSGAEEPFMIQCRKTTIDEIETIFVDKYSNPNKGDIYELIAACFVKKKLAPADYTKEKYRADLEKGMKNSVVNGPEPLVQECLFTPTAP